MTRWEIAGWLMASGISIWLAWLYISPHFNTYPEQDDCSFGPVSNERYRELLALARQHQASGRWSRLRGDGPTMNENLQDRLDDIMDGMDSICERIAATHAVMRALGAYYRATSPDFEDAFESARRRSLLVEFGSVGFVYILDVHKIGGFAPINRKATIHINFIADKTKVSGWEKYNNSAGYELTIPSSVGDGGYAVEGLGGFAMARHGGTGAAGRVQHQPGQGRCGAGNRDVGILS